MSELLDAAIEEIGRVLIGNKDRNTEEVYLKNAIRHIREYGSQPQLNENQQKYLKQLQYNRERLGNIHDALFFGLVDYEKRWNLNDEEFAQVLKIFANLALEQEEE
ncbi:hypothetical protein U8771_07585 [Enterococcus casseliflavus]|uniref:hypothetical protein n=1 Tax=Enterococcus casseliflavus TaxID=37734 RepID=UPI002D786FEA|nr:hypothetical protein [Enterococcus casseliflavus]WRO95840.1 hypothetical protein U8771_07585 [Enterococcus casseliflavus]